MSGHFYSCAYFNINNDHGGGIGVSDGVGVSVGVGVALSTGVKVIVVSWFSVKWKKDH